GGLHGQTVRRTRFDRQVFKVMFERSNVRTSLQTLVCRTAFDEPFDRVNPPLCSLLEMS
ncbi:hypothetical protein SK128_002617, partial [Halocaridina rubra]